VGAEISASLAEEALLYLKAPIMRVTGYDAVIPLPKLEDYYMPTVGRIKRSMDEIMKY
jgi:pyruvate dehydrogenase E1 component beta subunit